MTHDNLAAALAAAQADVSPLAKDGRNDHHRYRYTTSEAVIDEARRALAAHGLALLCVRAELHHEDVVETAASADGELRERPARHYTLRAVYVLAHGSERLELTSETPLAPERGRPLDKSVAAAKTYDLAYTLRAVLLIPRSDALAAAAEVDQRDDREVDVVAVFDAAATRAAYDSAVALAASALAGVGADDPRRVEARAAMRRARERVQ